MMSDFDAVLLALVSRLRAGMLPAAACDSLHEPGSAELPRLVNARAAQRFLAAHPQWREVLIALRLNRMTGASLVALFESQARQWKRYRSYQDQLRTLSLAGRATMLIICGLPLLMLLVGEVSGIAVFSAVHAQPITLLAMICGGGLLLAAAIWMRRILRQAAQTEPDAGLFLELCAAAVVTGLSLGRAVQVVDEIREFVGAHIRGESEVLKWQQLGRSSGMPLTPLLFAAAEQNRERQYHDRERALAMVPIRLLLPVGLLGLPGFLMMGVLPTAFAMLVSTGFGNG